MVPRVIFSSRPTAPAAPAAPELLDHFELDGALDQAAVAVDADAHRDDLGEAVLDPVVQDGAFLGLALVLSMDAMREMPFDEGHARHQWHVVEVGNLRLLAGDSNSSGLIATCL